MWPIQRNCYHFVMSSGRVAVEVRLAMAHQNIYYQQNASLEWLLTLRLVMRMKSVTAVDYDQLYHAGYHCGDCAADDDYYAAWHDLVA